MQVTLNCNIRLSKLVKLEVGESEGHPQFYMHALGSLIHVVTRETAYYSQPPQQRYLNVSLKCQLVESIGKSHGLMGIVVAKLFLKTTIISTVFIVLGCFR